MKIQNDKLSLISCFGPATSVCNIFLACSKSEIFTFFRFMECKYIQLNFN